MLVKLHSNLQLRTIFYILPCDKITFFCLPWGYSCLTITSILSDKFVLFPEHHTFYQKKTKHDAVQDEIEIILVIIKWLAAKKKKKKKKRR